VLGCQNLNKKLLLFLPEHAYNCLEREIYSMWISVVILIIFVVLFAVGLALYVFLDSEFGSVMSLIGAVASVMTFIFITVSSSVGIKTGYVGVERNFGGAYTGRVIRETGMHWYTMAPSHGVDKVDVRNNKLPVKVSVMKDKTYNVDASVEVVYDLNPDKLVNLKSNYSDYKNTVISATVKQVLTSNNTLANSQSLTSLDEQQIKDKLHKFGIEVTNIYMNSYKLTNSSNFGINSNNNNNNNNN